MKNIRSHSAMRIIAIIVTITTGFILFWGLNTLFRPVPVVVLKTNVPSGQLIKASDLTVVKVSIRDRHQEAYTNIESVTGKKDVPGMYAATDLFSGQQLIIKQTTDSPDKLRNALAGITEYQTVIEFTGAQAFWPDILRDGDFVMIQAFYPDRNSVDDIGVGRITKNTDTPITKNLSQISAPSNSQQSKQYLICSIKTEENALLALCQAKMIYLRPMHPKLGREGF